MHLVADTRLEAQQATHGEIVPLTSVRGVAALWVVLMHFAGILYAVLPEVSFLNPLIESGRYAVPLFFVLSGYVLGLRYVPKFRSPDAATVGRFLWLRLGRVYPVHLLTLLVSLGLVARRGWPTDDAHSVGRFAANLALVQAWGYDFRLSWNYPAWSISSEWFAYLIFPAVAVGLTRVGRTTTAVVLALACGLSVAVYAFEEWVAFKGLAVVVPTFIGGVCLAVVCPPGCLRERFGLLAELGALAGAALPFLVGPGPWLGAVYLVLFFGLVAVLGGVGNGSTAVWGFRPLVSLGNVSYALYMTHVLTLTLLARFIPFAALPERPLAVRAAVVLGCLVAIFSVTLATFYLVERPCRAWSRTLSSRYKTLERR